jgi:hypothetical protein
MARDTRTAIDERRAHIKHTRRLAAEASALGRCGFASSAPHSKTGLTGPAGSRPLSRSLLTRPLRHRSSKALRPRSDSDLQQLDRARAAAVTRSVCTSRIEHIPHPSRRTRLDSLAAGCEQVKFINTCESDRHLTARDGSGTFGVVGSDNRIHMNRRIE